MKDRLQEIWERQQNFDNIVLKKREKTKEHKDLTITDKTKEEFADCLHFLISLGQDIFKDEQEMFEWYCKKNDKNLLRQRNGY